MFGGWSMTTTKANMTVNKNYFTMIQIRNGLNKIVEQMNDEGFKPDIVMGINRGGCIPGIYLSHKLKIPHQVLDVRLRDHKSDPETGNVLDAILENKKVLIIDDINDTGATFEHIYGLFGEIKTIKYASILHNTPSKFDKLDYWCYTINKEIHPVWIVFPWEEWQ